VTKAAEKLSLSQPAVSAQLARLRDIFDDQLLIPAQRGMTPTQRAMDLQAPLHQALDGVRDVVTHGSSFDAATANLTVRIAAMDVIQYAVLAPFALSLRSRAPNIRVALRNVDTRLLEQQSENGDLDLCVVTAGTPAPSMRARKLMDTVFVVIARRDHPTLRGSITLEQFVALDHVITEIRNVTFSGMTDVALAALGHTRKVVLSTASFLVVADIIAHSDMIAVVPEGIVRKTMTSLQILKPPIPIDPTRLVMAWHERTQAHAGHRWVRDALVEFADTLSSK
jgi:DNA-binding transcriptional LysR family regulator